RLARSVFYKDNKGRSFDEIPDYDHREPGPVFDKLRRLILELSERIPDRPYRRSGMSRDGDQFHTNLPADIKKPGTRYFFEVDAPDSEAKLRTLFLVAK